MKQVDDLRRWYASLETRERKIVVAGTCALVLIIIWLAIVAPYLGARASLRSQIQSDQHRLVWMQHAVAQIDQLEKTATKAGPQTKQSLFSTVEQTARTSPVGTNIASFQPRGNDSVKLQLKSAPFDGLITWLGELKSKYGILATSFSVQRADAPGTVNANVTLKRSQP